MVQRRVTEYVCDSCGTSVERKRDLVRWRVNIVGGSDWPVADLCDDCEGRFVAAVAPFMQDENEIAGMRRGSK